MISDEDVKQLFQGCENVLLDYWEEDSLAPSQAARGITAKLWKNSYPTNCKRHKLVFETYNIIPRYCFDCYKITIELKKVIDLFKLLIVFDGIILPDNNTRKCMVERRPGVSGTYKGLINFQSLDSARNLLPDIEEFIKQEISDDIKVSLKRGCSEFSMKFPEYGKFDENKKPVMEYVSDWQQYENLADENGLANHLKPIKRSTYQQGFSHMDARVMLSWLKYAATIGDASYKKITDRPVRKVTMEHPRPPFNENE